MEGPTPVSALIHAATMVTAGVFLILKGSFFFENAPETLTFILFIGTATAFFAASVGVLQSDIKKIIAYSTCSQLGYMFLTCGLSAYNVSFFHLINHAFFKALLFLCAGAVIHSMANEQDLRRYGLLQKTLPLTCIIFIIASLALGGFPFLTGFYSKDFIIEISHIQYKIYIILLPTLCLITALITAFYSMRIIYLTFKNKLKIFRSVFILGHETPYRMTATLLVLAIASTLFGYFLKDFFIGIGSQN